MIGSLFRWGLLATLLGGSAFALVGKDQVEAYFKEGKREVRETLRDMRGLEGRLKSIRSRLADLDGETRDWREDAVRFRVETERLREDLARREDDLERRKDVLRKAQGLLADGRDRYDIGGRSYARAEVERDLTDKLAAFEMAQGAVTSLREALAVKEKALEIAGTNVARAREVRAQLESRVALLDAQLQKFRAKQAYAATADDASLRRDLDSDLARAREAMEEFERELEVKERLLDESLQQSGSPEAGTGIEYEPPVPAADLTARLRAALGDERQVTGVAQAQ